MRRVSRRQIFFVTVNQQMPIGRVAHRRKPVSIILMQSNYSILIYLNHIFTIRQSTWRPEHFATASLVLVFMCYNHKRLFIICPHASNKNGARLRCPSINTKNFMLPTCLNVGWFFNYNHQSIFRPKALIIGHWETIIKRKFPLPGRLLT